MQSRVNSGDVQSNLTEYVTNKVLITKVTVRTVAILQEVV